MNSYLRELADMCGIKKDLTFHCARHTFATTVTLTNGVPIETVSKMLGHKSLKTTQLYAKIVDKKVSEDMRALKEKYSRTAKQADKKARSHFFKSSKNSTRVSIVINGFFSYNRSPCGLFFRKSFARCIASASRFLRVSKCLIRVL